MSKIKLTGSNSGYVEIDSAADAGNLTLTLPTSGVRLLSNTDNVFSGITTTAELDINGKIDVSTDIVGGRNLKVTGITTLSDDVTFTGGSYNVLWDKSDNQLEFGDNAKLSFGDSSDLQIYHNGSNNHIDSNNNKILHLQANNLKLMTNDFDLINTSNSKTLISAINDNQVELFFNGNKKFETTNTGVIVTGICTATSFSGSGAGLTGLVTPLSFRNLIINGAMMVAQRGTTFNVTNGFGGPDRFRFQSNYSAVTMSQSTDVPSGQGFSKSLKLDVTTAGGDSNADTYTQIDYRFEGQELTRLKYGSSGAETTTISFWIKSPKAGIHWVRLYGDQLSSPAGGGNAFISRKYTVSSANTWQNVTLSFPGLTSDGFNNDINTGMRISWYFAQGSAYSSGTAQADDGGWLNWGSAGDRARNSVGQVNCFDSTSNDIFLTGVQFESASTATAFEHRSFTEELVRSYRYYNRVYDTEGQSGEKPASLGVYETGSAVTTIFNFPKMRTVPSLDITNGTNKFMIRSDSNSDHFSTMSLRYGTTTTAEIVASSSVSGNSGHSGFLRGADADVYIAFSAEL